jgi:hypothetical protein
MARIKSYYTTDETMNNLYTFGEEYMTLDRKEYKGPYHRYTTTNEIYTESVWNIRLSKQLIKYVKNNTTVDSYKNLKNIRVASQTPNSSAPTINKSVIDSGILTRYFIKKLNEYNVIEIDQQQYNDWINQKIDRTLYTAVLLTWHITGNLQDTTVNNVYTPGVITKNRQSIITAADQIPELFTYLTNLSEFYIDSTFYIPVDINRLDS